MSTDDQVVVINGDGRFLQLRGTRGVWVSEYPDATTFTDCRAARPAALLFRGAVVERYGQADEHVAIDARGAVTKVTRGES